MKVVDRMPWTCYPNFITCRPDGDGKEHLLRFHQTGYRADLRRITGHAFFECRQCAPSTYIFAVFSTTPSPEVRCYEISKASYDEWDKDTANETFTTQEMLYRLKDPDGHSLNPFWRPPR